MQDKNLINHNEETKKKLAMRLRDNLYRRKQQKQKTDKPSSHKDIGN